MKFRLSLLSVIMISAVLLGSCDRSRVFDKNKDVDQEGWIKEDFVKFEVDIKDSLQPYNVFVNVRNTTEYNYSNIYFFIRTLVPGGQEAADTINCWLAQPDGKWLGSGMGKYRDSQIPLLINVRFPRAGKYVFELEQAMREEKLKGIAAVGIRVEKAKQN